MKIHMEDVKMRLNLLFLLSVLFTFGAEGDIVGQNGFPPHRAIKGSDSVIPCTSDVNGPPVQTIIWYFQHKEILRYDGEIRAVDPRYSLSTNRARDGTASLVISNITITDGGTYTCSLLYGQGKEDMEVTVDIQAIPEITVTNNIVVRNQESVLRCSVTGFYPLGVRIKWLREGVLLHRINVGTKQRNPDGTYNVNTTATILPTEEDQDQTFSCSVQYGSHDTFQKDFQLIYGVPPSIQISSQPFRLNEEQTLVCRVWGFYPESVVVSWFLDGTPMEASRIERMSSSVVSFYQFAPTVQLWGTEISCAVEHGTLASPLVEKVLVKEPDLKVKHRMVVRIVTVITLAAAVALVCYCNWKKRGTKEPICPTPDKKTTFQGVIRKLEMTRYNISKLTLKDVLKIGPDSVQKIENKTIKDAPWYFLMNLMCLNPEARTTCMSNPSIGAEYAREDNSERNNNSMCDPIHPLDVLYVLLHCSEPCLQQEMMSKMSLCQFAVPLLLPAADGHGCTFMLWAMRDIVKRWKNSPSTYNKSFQEATLTDISMPMFSFMRLGKCSFSKSDVANKVLSQASLEQEFFLHRDMEAGYIPRKISDGLVEIAWHFPGSKEKSSVFQNPFAVTNMRGDLELSKDQFRFLCRISSVVFIFTERFDDREYNILAESETANQNCSINIVLISDSTSEDTNICKDLLEKMRCRIWKVSRKYNNAYLAKELKKFIGTLAQNGQNSMNLENISLEANHFGFHIDEKIDELQRLKTFAQHITGNIENIVQCKEEAMRRDGPSDGDSAQTEGEMGSITPGAEYGKNEVKSDRKSFDISQTQSPDHFADENFLCLTQTRKWFLLKSIKLYFQSFAIKSRQQLCGINIKKCGCFNQTDKCKLHDSFRDFDNRLLLFNESRDYQVNNHNRQTQSDNCEQVCYVCLLTILRPFLGTQSNPASGWSKYCCCIWRYIDVNDFVANGNEETFSKLPEIAADLLLDGFPLKLINDDSSIPLEWVSSIFTELDKKTGGKCRMRVISVLGAQRSGKATLLNTMFGLQFPMARGRCTRGAFMTLINVKENFQKELKCDFILLIDTDFIGSPEPSQESNALATLVVGVSDVTIVNVGMENRDEMEINLQSVIRALYSAKKERKKLSCLFVHQGDIQTYEDHNQENLLDQLNNMTKNIAKNEKIQVTQFSDIIESNVEIPSHYIPNLLESATSMAPVNAEYSQCVHKLKEHLISHIKDMDGRAQSIHEFSDSLKHLGKTVK
ncbi:interferon-induced very large GTPase 1 isoform X2 [Xenopus tropicalis]|nr:interferon-induced very large GTPase 1 isoform X2 [Xenopus tropicalis]